MTFELILGNNLLKFPKKYIKKVEFDSKAIQKKINRVSGDVDTFFSTPHVNLVVEEDTEYHYTYIQIIQIQGKIPFLKKETDFALFSDMITYMLKEKSFDITINVIHHDKLIRIYNFSDMCIQTHKESSSSKGDFLFFLSLIEETSNYHKGIVIGNYSIEEAKQFGIRNMTSLPSALIQNNKTLIQYYIKNNLSPVSIGKIFDNYIIKNGHFNKERLEILIECGLDIESGSNIDSQISSIFLDHAINSNFNCADAILFLLNYRIEKLESHFEHFIKYFPIWENQQEDIFIQICEKFLKKSSYVMITSKELIELLERNWASYESNKIRKIIKFFLEQHENINQDYQEQHLLYFIIKNCDYTRPNNPYNICLEEVLMMDDLYLPDEEKEEEESQTLLSIASKVRNIPEWIIDKLSN